MRMVAWTLLGAFAGVVAGVVLSEIIGVTGILLFDQPAGVRYLPVYIAVACAATAPALAAWLRHRRR